MTETPIERVLRLLKVETGSTEFQQDWRLHRNRAEGNCVFVAVIERRSQSITIADDDTEEQARAKVLELAPKLTPIGGNADS